MVKTADSRQGQNVARLVRACFNGPSCRRRLLQSEVRTIFVIVAQIFKPKPPEMLREFAASLCSYRGEANNRSAQLPQEKADTHLDVAVDLSLAGGCGHEMAAAHTLVESNTTHVDLFAFERAGEPYRIGRDLPSQVRTPAKLAMSWLAGLFGD